MLPLVFSKLFLAHCMLSLDCEEGMNSFICKEWFEVLNFEMGPPSIDWFLFYFFVLAVSSVTSSEPYVS